jgi:muramoyltetrapeptide carboxypeptidase
MNIATSSPNEFVLLPPSLKVGDKVRFISPASTPDRESVLQGAKILESWGLEVDFGEHVFNESGYLAGTDEERLSDLNSAFRDPKVRAVFSTRGGKGSYRIADRIDFGAVRRDPKFLIGFSDITALHLSLWKQCRLIGVHGALGGEADVERNEALRTILTKSEPTVIRSREDETTCDLTTTGNAVGRLVGGNLDMIATAAGWSLPSLNGAILLLEAVNMGLGHVDRELSMLRKAGHLAGVAGVAVGQFTDFSSHGDFTVVDLLREHLQHLDVPILGGLPLGHGKNPTCALIGSMATLDTVDRTLTIRE